MEPCDPRVDYVHTYMDAGVVLAAEISPQIFTMEDQRPV